MTLVETHVLELTYIVQHDQPGLSIFSGRVLKNTESSDGLINVVHTSSLEKKNNGGTGLSQVVAKVLGNFMVMIAWHAVLGG